MRSSSLLSVRVFLFMVPLMILAGYVSVKHPEATNWISTSRQPFTGAKSNTDDNVVSAVHNISNSVAISSNGQEQVLETRVVITAAAVDSHNQIEEAKADDTSLNRSSSPLLSVHPDNLTQPLLQQNGSQEINFLKVNVSNDKTTKLEYSFNESYIPMKEILTTKNSPILNKAEVGLFRARAAIRAAIYGNQSQDPDFLPTGPMYWNAKSFHRSYLEMEKKFKVFVYEEGEPPVFHNGPCKSIYSMEGNFIHGIEMNSQYRTRDPEQAHVFFLPFSVAMMVRFVYVLDSHDFSPIKKTVQDYLNVIGNKYPYWNRSLGADHFMLACHDWGPETSFSNPLLYKNAIRVLCNANISEGFNPAKDVSFPEINLQTGTIDGLVWGPSPSKRSILAFFAGGLHGPIRPIVLEHWENKDEDVRVHRYLPKGVSYYDMLRNSKYCLCPSGYEVASPRLVEAIYTGCVPVLISDHYVPPFSDVLNWKSFSVEVAVSDIPNLKRILTSISPRQYLRMQRRVLQVRRHFEVNNPPKRYDVFSMILHSVWLRRLNVRVHDDQ